MSKTSYDTSPQHQEILAVLQSGQSLTVHDMHMMGINAATSRICELRKAGYNIISTKRNHINKRGKTVKINVYSLKGQAS